MQMPRGENKIELQGRVLDRPTLSHTNHGADYYRLPLSVPRLSGAEDELNLILPQQKLEAWTPDPDQWVYAEGEVRSFNNKSGVGNKLVITVLVRELFPAPEEEGLNRLELGGTLCKRPVLRRTPLGRDICDLLLAVNRTYGRADYLPCIAWGTVAVACGGLSVGDRLKLSGRLQSRRYRKVVDGREESRVAYEISVMNLLENPQ
jgi:primosomal replication protein N